MNNKSTEDLYDASASKWVRQQPSSLSDFTARPVIFDLCGDVRGLDIIDLGAGEGYCARVLASQGAAKVVGVELSSEMVATAKSLQGVGDDVIEYKCGTVTALDFPDLSFDLALGVFVYNYLHIQDLYKSLQEVYRVLRPGGRFIFSVPHPSFPFIRKDLEEPFYFDLEGKGYFSSRDHLYDGKIFCRNGSSLDVQMIPKSLEDFFSAFQASGFSTMPKVLELRVTPDLIEFDSDFFSPLTDLPLHMAFELEK